MSYLHHIRRCNTHDLSGFRPFLVDGAPVGWVRHGTAAKLTRFPAIFRLENGAVCIHPDRTDPEDRSAAVGRALAELADGGEMEPLREELYPVKTSWHGPELFRLDRSAAPLFGLRAWGVHATGYVRDADGGYRMWIGRRAPDKRVSPDKLDSTIGGGQPAGLAFRDNLYKEAEEENAMPRPLAQKARSVGAVTYCMENEAGLKPDTLVLFDIELPEDFTPRSTDGEHTGFELMPVDEVLRIIRETEDFKFNVPLVVLDFCVRHGLLTPDDTPDYESIVQGLRSPFPVP
ncbi:NTP pyrophosphohydrolase [Caenispirillum salinarum AK4]|uniref:NTP pyrophosphohydrolase n=1 Tax=Caenispirillum salinarum AK4 TaxID=1238182 RepID=K9GV94_9PROT|nr:DUF4743 domain-containing protein [Caenispirillum salinarum]EKV28619.1 NTP pyrophosphohydrolase [Caenispirillum salinarum AK4]